MSDHKRDEFHTEIANIERVHMCGCETCAHTAAICPGTASSLKMALATALINERALQNILVAKDWSSKMMIIDPGIHKDTLRMNWLETLGADVEQYADGSGQPWVEVTVQPVNGDPEDLNCKVYIKNTLREAIDLAMETTNER